MKFGNKIRKGIKAIHSMKKNCTEKLKIKRERKQYTRKIENQRQTRKRREIKECKIS